MSCRAFMMMVDDDSLTYSTILVLLLVNREVHIVVKHAP